MNLFRKYVYNAYNDQFLCIQLYTVMRAQCSRTHERHLSDKAAPQRRTSCSLQTLFPMHPERESISAVDCGRQVCTQTDVKRAAREAL